MIRDRQLEPRIWVEIAVSGVPESPGVNSRSGSFVDIDQGLFAAYLMHQRGHRAWRNIHGRDPSDGIRPDSFRATGEGRPPTIRRVSARRVWRPVVPQVKMPAKAEWCLNWKCPPSGWGQETLIRMPLRTSGRAVGIESR
jgi:hypothetical protein